MSGPNFILDKGYAVDAAATNVEYGRFCKFSDTTGKNVTTSAAPAAAAAADFIVGVYQDTVDAAKVATDKHVINVRLIGISRVQVGAGAIAVGDRITSDANGKAVVATATAGATKWAPGIALSASLAAGWINCLIIPGNVITNGGT
jgi:hypothetical protein